MIKSIFPEYSVSIKISKYEKKKNDTKLELEQKEMQIKVSDRKELKKIQEVTRLLFPDYKINIDEIGKNTTKGKKRMRIQLTSLEESKYEQRIQKVLEATFQRYIVKVSPYRYATEKGNKRISEKIQGEK